MTMLSFMDHMLTMISFEDIVRMTSLNQKYDVEKEERVLLVVVLMCPQVLAHKKSVHT